MVCVRFSQDSICYLFTAPQAESAQSQVTSEALGKYMCVSLVIIQIQAQVTVVCQRVCVWLSLYPGLAHLEASWLAVTK